MGKIETTTVTRARALNKPGPYRADPTLYNAVAPGDSKSWIQRITVNGKRQDIGVGGFPLVTLAEAHEAAYEYRRLVHGGGDPLAQRRKANRRNVTPTFRKAAEMTYRSLRPRWKNARVAVNWMQQLERHALKRLGDIPVDRIGGEDVLAVLTPIWTTKPETARRVRRYIKATLRCCQAHGWVRFNAAGEAIDCALPRMTREIWSVLNILSVGLFIGHCFALREFVKNRSLKALLASRIPKN